VVGGVSVLAGRDVGGGGGVVLSAGETVAGAAPPVPAGLKTRAN